MKKILFPTFVLMVMAACGGGGGTNSEDSSNPMAGVYMSGASSSDVTANALVWKDGDVTLLEASAVSTSVFVTDDNVYMSGIYVDGVKDKPCYWQGETKTNLDVPAADEGFTTSIYVSGSDIYVAGYYDNSGNDTACYWKNGVKVDLGEGQAQSIFIYEGSIYVAGYDDANKAAYWKDGVKVGLSAFVSVAYDIEVVNGDVYVAGTVLNGNTYAVYWKNGVITELTDGATDAFASSIAVYGSDVYVSGQYQDYSKVGYWKNDQAGIVNLSTGSYVPMDSLVLLSMPKIFINDGDIYVTAALGADPNDATVGGYWKNGEFSTPTGGIYSSIFVK